MALEKLCINSDRIFILEGVISCVIAIGGYLFLVDFPEKAKNSWRFLSYREIQFIIRRVDKDRGDAVLEAFTYGRFLRPALDLKIWGFALIFFSYGRYGQGGNRLTDNL